MRKKEEVVKRGDEGSSYELNFGIRLLLWLSSDKKKYYDFKYGTQLKNAGKFDDAIIGYQEREGDRFQYFLCQLKHRSTVCPAEILTMKDFVHNHSSEKCTGKPFCLKEYFKSFQSLSVFRKELKDGDLKKIFNVTNRSVNLESFKNSGIQIEYDKYEFLQGKCFKFSESSKNNLKEDLKIPKEHIGQLRKFLDMLVISFEEMSNPEIKSELENKLKEKHS